MTSYKLAYWDIQFYFVHNLQNNSYFDVFQVSIGEHEVCVESEKLSWKTQKLHLICITTKRTE